MRPEYDSALELFAPYQCQYKPEVSCWGKSFFLPLSFQSSKAQSCLRQQGRSRSFFHGDSQVRGSVVYLSQLLGISSMTPEEMKHLTNVKGVKVNSFPQLPLFSLNLSLLSLTPLLPHRISLKPMRMLR
jgi:hypothetical protein